MDAIQNILFVLGFMVCSYTVFHLLIPIVKKYDDALTPPFYIKVLVVVSSLFFFGGIFVGLLDYLLWSKPHIKSALDEVYERHDAIDKINKRVYSELEAENRRLRQELKDVRIDSYFEGRDSGYESGYRSGFMDAVNDHAAQQGIIYPELFRIHEDARSIIAANLEAWRRCGEDDGDSGSAPPVAQ